MRTALPYRYCIVLNTKKCKIFCWRLPLKGYCNLLPKPLPAYGQQCTLKGNVY